MSRQVGVDRGVGGAAPRWLDAGEQAAWRAYLDSFRLLVQSLDRQLHEDADISLTDFELLVHLSEVPGHRLRMSELADGTLSTRSGATRAVTRLEEQGWVVRVQCEGDRRGTFAELTAAGMAKLEQSAPGHVEAVRQYMFDLLDADQVAQVRIIGTLMRDRMGHPAG